MHVILVNGSPHAKGCTNRALEEVQAQLTREGATSSIFWIGANVRPCLGCYQCRTLGHCVIDDTVRDFLKQAETADAFIFGSPVYYSSATGSITAFLDRAFFSGGAVLSGKPAASVVSCRRGGATATFAQLNMYALINQMPIVPSNYWNQVHGNTPQEVEQDAEGLQTLRLLASNLVWLLRSIQAGREAGVPPPLREQKIATNFIR